MNNLSIMEINEIRPFFSRAYHEMSKLNHAEATAREDETQEITQDY